MLLKSDTDLGPVAVILTHARDINHEAVMVGGRMRNGGVMDPGNGARRHAARLGCSRLVTLRMSAQPVEELRET